MEDKKVLRFIEGILQNMPTDWLKLTTHRLDIYDEKQAKTQFLDQFEILFSANNSQTSALSELPTAYDYIRLGHPLSTILEWSIAQLNNLAPAQVISFSSKTTPILAVLRKNLLENKKNRIIYTESLPEVFNTDVLKNVYGYNFELTKITGQGDVPAFDGSTVFISQVKKINGPLYVHNSADFTLHILGDLGSVLTVNNSNNDRYISEIQHVRRRESIAMTPANCFIALRALIEPTSFELDKSKYAVNRKQVHALIHEITGSDSKAVLGSSGLSIQYAIMMGLIDDALVNHPGKAIKFIVPPNCYGGTNDQARRVAACIENVEIVDLPVDGDNDMVRSVDAVLESVAKEDAVPYIIAEIPTNPRVEVPDLEKLRDALNKVRTTVNGQQAIDPVFILDQTFCPNVQFLTDAGVLSSVRTISYVSGSKFPSGGKCTAGYSVANKKASGLMETIDKHLVLCDNEATPLQVELLAEQLPSMNQRILDAYKNTRDFVNFIKETLPSAKINFVSEELAQQGFTPSVFSLDLPTKGSTHEEREAYKRELNDRLIQLMITRIPNESKYCVSYGQLKGCYWTIPATSTQGTTKEGDKDYIVRVALSHNMDLELHKNVFLEFVRSMD
jgi:cystathionine beta-lyase/cystathionine gamma-synthase